MPKRPRAGSVTIPRDAEERGRLFDEAGLSPTEREAVEKFLAIKTCPHSADQIDRRNPCSCGIYWRYDEGIEGYRRAD